jgi:hypothetical protein
LLAAAVYPAMRKILLMLLALSACRDGESAGNESAGRSKAPPVQTASLTGLYEGGAAQRRNQMCIVERDGAAASFGFVTWAERDQNCSGDGEAVRQGNVLRLTMTGDEQCVIEARIDGTRVTLPGQLPEGCGYYCGRGATLAGASFDKVGGTLEDARRAVDLVGDPLCQAPR